MADELREIIKQAIEMVLDKEDNRLTGMPREDYNIQVDHATAEIKSLFTSKLPKEQNTFSLPIGLEGGFMYDEKNLHNYIKGVNFTLTEIEKIVEEL